MDKLILPTAAGRADPDSIVGFISGDTVKIWFMHSLHQMFKADARNRFGADFILVYGPYIHQNRNELQRDYMDVGVSNGRDWLLMLDNDMVFQPLDVWRLFEEADKRGPGIYSAPYILENSALVCGPWDDENPVAYHPMMMLPEEVCEVGVVGMGFTLIHRTVFEAVGPDAFSPVEGNVGEDVSFCYRAAQEGITPVLVPQCNPGHHKTVVLYPHEQVRNMIGEEVNLVRADPELRRLNSEMERSKA